MSDSNTVHWVKVGLTFILSIISGGGLLGYLYILFGNFYRKRENRWWVGVLATGLPLIATSFGLLIWMIWNPLVRTIIWPLFFLGFFISIILGQTVTSPYRMADWWIEFGRWLQKRKSK